MNFAPYTLLKQ